jgi:hypothetical protein
MVKLGLFLSFCLAIDEYFLIGMNGMLVDSPFESPSMKSRMSPNLYSFKREVKTKLFLFYWFSSIVRR